MRAVIAKDKNAKGAIDDVPMPKPKSGEILVRVIAASVNPVDWKTVERGEKPFPMVMGQDFAGVVVETGTSDEIFGSPRHPYTQELLAAVPHLGGAEIDITAALVQATGAENLVVDVTAEELKRREEENARLTTRDKLEASLREPA